MSVWEIGTPVWGVHTEVENGVCTVYVTKEKIVEFHEKGGWQSEGKVNGVTVKSELMESAYDFREQAVKYADKIAKEAEDAMSAPCGWTKVVKVYAK